MICQKIKSPIKLIAIDEKFLSHLFKLDWE